MILCSETVAAHKHIPYIKLYPAIASPFTATALAWARCRFSRFPFALAASALRLLRDALLLDCPTMEGRSLQEPPNIRR